MYPVSLEPPFTPSEDALYPSSDGQPMAETELHADEMTELKLMLRHFFRAETSSVYVGCNLFVYYEQGNASAVFSPDVFVVRGAPQRQYDTYKLWKDGPAPCFAIEVTSKSTRLEDRGNKKAVCEMLGVQEYFMYDPRAEYLDPALQGFRLNRGQYEPIAANDSGALISEALGLSLSLDSTGLIVLTNSKTGEHLLRVDEERQRLDDLKRQAEAEQQRERTERLRAEAEQQRERTERLRAEAEQQRERTERLRAEARLAAALEEVERLRR